MVKDNPYVIKKLDNWCSNRREMWSSSNFLCVIGGTLASGKTTFLINVCTRVPEVKDQFDSCLYVSPTFFNDRKLQLLKTTPWLRVEKSPFTKDDPQQGCLKHIITEPSKAIDEIRKIRAERMSNSDPTAGVGLPRDPETGRVKDRKLIIIDDCVGEKLLESPELVNLCLNLRHCNVSVIIACQHIARVLSTKLRNNATLIVLAEMFSARVRTFMWENFAGWLTRKQWDKILKEVFGGSDHNFLVLHLLHEDRFKVSKNRTEFLYFKKSEEDASE